jgi:hypothetical protein
MATYLILSGMAYEVTADTEEEALAKFYAEDAGDDCPCGFPQWAEESAEEGHELCDCVNQHEVLTHVIGVDND